MDKSIETLINCIMDHNFIINTIV